MKKRVFSMLLAAFMFFGSIDSNSFNICAAENKLLAFPGAEGGGMYTKGARAAENFEIYHVTNLDDSGDGSFRDAVSQSNRIIVFDVAGNIMLENKIIVKSSNLTILGQTAPGEGVCIGGNSVQFEYADNIIIRYLRFRSGEGSYEDSLGGKGCSNVIIDHCSISWSVDELLSWYGSTDFTAQWNIISEALRKSTHAKGTHGYGGLWGGTNASFHHNLLANNESRNPRIGSTETLRASVPDTEALIDVRNNVIYSWSKNAGYGGENGVRVNFVNNYFKPTDIAIVHTFYEFYSGRNSCIDGVDSQSTTLHLSGNVMEGMKDLTDDNYKGLDFFSNGQYWWIKRENISEKGVVMHGFEETDKEVPEVLLPNDQYLSDYPVKTQTAEEAYTDVLKYAGASLHRDTIDERVVKNVKNGVYPNGSNGSIGFVDSVYDVGGWCWLQGGKKPEDTDLDGIPDSWEDNNGLDKNDPSDAAQISSSGYTNIELYANSLVESFTEIKVNRVELGLAVSRSMYLERWKFEEEDIKKIDAETETAKIILGTSEDQDEINDETEKLNNMLDSLVPRYRNILERLVAETEQKISGFEPQQYSRESLDALMSAINKSKTDLEEEEDNELFKEDAELLQSALDSLEESLLEEFKQKKEDARAQYITSGRYTSSSTQLMQQVIDEADALAASPDATNAQMRDMMSKIDETSKKMVLLDNTTLKNAVFYLSDGLFARDSLTDKSQKDAETLKAEGLELSQTQSGENDAALKFYDKVKNALIGLEYKDGYKSIVYTEDLEAKRGDINAEYVTENGSTYIRPAIDTVIPLPLEKIDNDTYLSADLMLDDENSDTMLFRYELENKWDCCIVMDNAVDDDRYMRIAFDNKKFTLNSDDIKNPPFVEGKRNTVYSNYNEETGVLTVYLNNALVYKKCITENAGNCKKLTACDLSAPKLDSYNLYTFIENKGSRLGNINIFKLNVSNKPFLYGDADADGSITASDAAFVLQKTLTEESILPIQNKTDDWFKYIDVDKDRYITASDAAEIMQKTLQESYFMPAEK